MIFVEYFSKGESHSDGNASLLALLIKKYSNETFYVFCSFGHFECLKNILQTSNIPVDNIQFHNIETYPEKYEYSRFFIDFKLVKQIFDFAKKNNEKKIFSTYTTTLFLYYLKLFLLLNPSIFLITTIHSELERLYILKYSNGFNGLRKYFTILYCIFFGLYLPLSINLKNYKCLVYGESIKQNLLKKVPLLKSNTVIAINHPYITNSIESTEPFKHGKVNFGLIGLIDKKKNGTNLLKLLQILKEQNTNKFKISFIGHIRNKMTEEYLGEALKFDFVERASDGPEFISRKLRDELETKVDYNIYTYNIDGYKLTASGAFMDAISFEKPVIAIKNDFFEYYFNKFGNIGYLFDNVNDMAKKMIEITANPNEEEYFIQRENIKTIKRYIDINYISNSEDFYNKDEDKDDH